MFNSQQCFVRLKTLFCSPLSHAAAAAAAVRFLGLRALLTPMHIPDISQDDEFHHLLSFYTLLSLLL